MSPMERARTGFVASEMSNLPGIDRATDVVGEGVL